MVFRGTPSKSANAFLELISSIFIPMILQKVCGYSLDSLTSVQRFVQLKASKSSPNFLVNGCETQPKNLATHLNNRKSQLTQNQYFSAHIVHIVCQDFLHKKGKSTQAVSNHKDAFIQHHQQIKSCISMLSNQFPSCQSFTHRLLN